MITLHVFPPSPRSFRVLSVANHLGLPYDVRIVDLARGGQNAPEFVALNPNRKAPVLVDGDFVLWESHAITQYLASMRPESGLCPEDERGHADMTRWQCWDLAHWDPACARFIGQRVVKKLLGLGDPDPAVIQQGEQEFHRYAAVLDSHLANRRYLLGDTLTVVDFCLGSPLNLAAPAQLPVERYANIRRWHATLSELPAWGKALAVAAAA
jgi:glutathione S-transferase